MTVLTPIGALLIAIELIAHELGPVSKTLALLLLIVAGVLFLVDIIRPFVARTA